MAVEAPLEDIVRGIEEVDSVPGRCELIHDERTWLNMDQSACENTKLQLVV